MTTRMMGVDEAGRGPVIGPLVVCSLCIPKTDYDILISMGVDDSKKLSKGKRNEIYKEILGFVDGGKWSLGISISSPLEIDANSINSDLNTLEVNLFVDSILKAANNYSEGTIFVDACDVNEKRFGLRLREKLGNNLTNWNMVSKHRMDSENIVTGAASIVAKVFRDDEIKKIEKNLEIEIGSGYPADPKTLEAVKILCRGNVPHDSLRWSWSTVRRVWKDLGKGTVPCRNYNGEITKETRIDDWG